MIIFSGVGVAAILWLLSTWVCLTASRIFFTGNYVPYAIARLVHHLVIIIVSFLSFNHSFLFHFLGENYFRPPMSHKLDSFAGFLHMVCSYVSDAVPCNQLASFHSLISADFVFFHRNGIIGIESLYWTIPFSDCFLSAQRLDDVSIENIFTSGILHQCHRLFSQLNRNLRVR